MIKPKSDLPQGTLDLLILKVVALGPVHGYAIAQRLQQVSRDVVQVQQGSLYPGLAPAGEPRPSRRGLEGDRDRFRRWWCTIPLLLSCADKLAAQTTTTHRPSPQILILHSYHVGYLWSDDVMEGIRSTFRESGLVVQPHVEYMDVRRHATPEHLRLLHAYYQHKFRDLSFDV